MIDRAKALGAANAAAPKLFDARDFSLVEFSLAAWKTSDGRA